MVDDFVQWLRTVYGAPFSSLPRRAIVGNEKATGAAVIAHPGGLIQWLTLH
jgi:hypothetical protein